MDNSETPPVKLTPRSSRRRALDIALGITLVAVIIFLAHSLITQLNLKHEVQAAKTVTNQLVNDIRKQNGTDARKLGDKTFQSQNTAANLTAQFKAASSLTTDTTSVDKQTVTNANGSQAVSVIYKFAGKSPFYIRVIVVKAKGASTFQVVNLSANTSEKPLLNNNY